VVVKTIRPSDAMFCKSEGCDQQANQPFRCQGLVEGQFVEDIVLDTGCSRTLVKGDLVSKENLILESVITVQCAHGDVVLYLVAWRLGYRETLSLWRLEYLIDCHSQCCWEQMFQVSRKC